LIGLIIAEDSSSKDEKNRIYKPTSKLAELAASFKSVRDAREQKGETREERRERERESRFEPRQV
jgi:hypothetical protein